MEQLDGKVAIVTGGASGIGLALGRAFAAEGARVVLADIEADALDKAVAELPDGTEVEAVTCDVADAAQVDALRDRALERFGAVHVVCNNAGVSSGGLVWEQSLDDWDWVLGVNLMGVVHGVKAFTPLMIEQGEGHIVNTASMAGLTSPPFMAIYNVTKHAVVTLSETLFADLRMAGAEGVGVSVLCPGWVQTRIHEAGRNRPGPSGDPAEAMPSGFSEFVGGLIASGLDPADVAGQVLDAVKARRFYVLTHPEWDTMISGRVDRILAREDPSIATLPM
ncbi:MAG TPA: SDR family NAD(P)-dependent oxidoreductase [Aquihabitans sp.]|jgi:NAD(P)-dependent dehydrogenase (short-subunit alcohol dehydrogenase family)|nr:SDR family NAD(P)-dependent oxidoreductase [Aquihabitans sp.]